MLENNKKYVLIFIILCVFIIIIVIGYYFISSVDNDEYIDFEENEITMSQEELIEEKGKIVIHISGCVVEPGVVELEEGARLIDAINMAGGLNEEADITRVNLAYILEDAQKIYIPSKNDKENEEIISSEMDEKITNMGENSSTTKESLMININKATQVELEKLPGIGSSIALRIVNYRNENGKFNTIEDIKNVSGIGDSKFNNIKDYICVK